MPLFWPAQVQQNPKTFSVSKVQKKNKKQKKKLEKLKYNDIR